MSVKINSAAIGPTNSTFKLIGARLVHVVIGHDRRKVEDVHSELTEQLAEGKADVGFDALAWSGVREFAIENSELVDIAARELRRLELDGFACGLVCEHAKCSQRLDDKLTRRKASLSVVHLVYPGVLFRNRHQLLDSHVQVDCRVYDHLFDGIRQLFI